MKKPKSNVKRRETKKKGTGEIEIRKLREERLSRS